MYTTSVGKGKQRIYIFRQYINIKFEYFTYK